MALTVLMFSAALISYGAEPAAPRGAVDVQGPVAKIREVGPDGKGSKEAAQAWKQLTQAEVSQLPEILAGMDGANAVARNWLRSAMSEVLERAKADKKAVPVAALESFVLDTKHHPQSRRLAYELILEVDAKASDRFLPNMADDPSPELRRDAVARIIQQAEKAKTEQKPEALALFQKAFASARDKDQLDKSAKQLRELGQQVDLAKHLGLILDWKLVGPFPNVEQKGIGIAYPPEKQLDFTAGYDGLKGKVGWKDYTSTNEYGIVDLDKAISNDKLAVGYAATEFTSASARDVEIRIGCYNAFKLWVNGQMVLERGDAYTGMFLDHYTVTAHLKAGKNTILIKPCRIDMPGAPNMWKFQLRVCDETGVAILSTTRPATPAPEKKS